MASADSQGLYLYAIVPAGEGVALGTVGVEGSQVFTIPYRGLCAIVHRCPAQPYQSPNAGVVEGWVKAHHQVVEMAWQRWGTVLPARFDLIIAGNGEDLENNLLQWLGQEYERLVSRLEQLRGKAEYAFQVFWDTTALARELLSCLLGPALDEEARVASPGTAYLLQAKLKGAIGKELEAQARRYFQEFYSQLRPWAAEVKIEKVKKAPAPYEMLMNLSCLLVRGEEGGVGEVVEGIRGKRGFEARFTGPFPPYSFAGTG